MSEHTPTTDEIRAGWIVGETRDGHGVDHDDLAPKVSAEFDRWLDQVKAEARREGQTEAWIEGRTKGVLDTANRGTWNDDGHLVVPPTPNPYEFKGGRHVDQ